MLCSYLNNCYTNSKINCIREKLFEYDHEEKDKRFWVFRKGFVTRVRTNRDLENPLVDVPCLILNWMKMRRNPCMQKGLPLLKMFMEDNPSLNMTYLFPSEHVFIHCH